MDDASAQKLQEMEVKLDAILQSVEKMRKNFRITMWVTIIVIVVPLIGMAFVLPMFLNSYLGSLGADTSSSGASDHSQIDQLRELLQ